MLEKSVEQVTFDVEEVKLATSLWAFAGHFLQFFCKGGESLIALYHTARSGLG